MLNSEYDKFLKGKLNSLTKLTLNHGGVYTFEWKTMLQTNQRTSFVRRFRPASGKEIAPPPPPPPTPPPPPPPPPPAQQTFTMPPSGSCVLGRFAGSLGVTPDYWHHLVVRQDISGISLPKGSVFQGAPASVLFQEVGATFYATCSHTEGYKLEFIQAVNSATKFTMVPSKEARNEFTR